jgi:hypothetical protein
MSRLLMSGGVCAALLALTACEASKSAHPLSPSVAGPIPGVSITTPKPVDPTSGSKVAVDKQPLTLVVQNASTSGVRPLSYVFEVATDAAFANKVFVRDGVTPGDGGRTSIKLPDPLATERAYFWRSRAQDGANASDYSTPATFNVFTPIVIGVPLLMLPAGNTTVAGVRPRFTIGDAPRSGPVGAITYQIELSDTDAFVNKAAAWSAPELPNQTTLDTPVDLLAGTLYFWHVRAVDPTTIGPWSAAASFTTAAGQAPPPPIAPAPGGPVAGDGVNLFSASIHNSPSDVASWAVTTSITRLSLMPTGAHVEFSKQSSWPDVVPPGFSGPLQYTLWIVLNINGQWHASGCIQYWRGLFENGGPPAQYAKNWYFDPARWGPMVGHQPAVGEPVGFLVTAGDARNNGPFKVKERSAVVVVPFPPNSGQTFAFSASTLGSIRFR